MTEKEIDKETKNYSMFVMFSVLLVLLICVTFIIKEIILSCSLFFMIVALMFVYIAREKADEKQDIRTNLLLVKFYLKSAFFLIITSVVIAFIFIAYKYWSIISIVS